MCAFASVTDTSDRVCYMRASVSMCLCVCAYRLKFVFVFLVVVVCLCLHCSDLLCFASFVSFCLFF